MPQLFAPGALSLTALIFWRADGFLKGRVSTKTRIETFIDKSIATGRRFTLLGILAALATYHAAGDDLQQQHAHPGNAVPARLVEIVRNNTRHFIDVYAATGAGYQPFQFVNSPSRFGLAAFFELHVWAWRDNPYGAFVDWNTRVSCEGQ